jgi:hypothetical protein
VILKPINLSQGGLIIGKLGGYFYPIPIQCKDLDTFFYSPSTRLMIAGSVGTNELYSAVLPGPKEIWFPELKIKKTLTKTVLSWDAEQNPLTLEVSANKVSWKKVTSKKVTKHGTTKVTVPNSKKRLYYRLNYP